jgi:hypothetical protein
MFGASLPGRKSRDFGWTAGKTRPSLEAAGFVDLDFICDPCNHLRKYMPPWKSGDLRNKIKRDHLPPIVRALGAASSNAHLTPCRTGGTGMTPAAVPGRGLAYRRQKFRSEGQ